MAVVVSAEAMARRRAARPVPHQVESIADRVARLQPCHRNPERFHEEKSEIVYELHELARALGAPR